MVATVLTFTTILLWGFESVSGKLSPGVSVNDWCQTSQEAFSVDARAALAGGLAGGCTNGLLHPLDTAKTLRQRNPQQFKSTLNAMVSTVATRGPWALYGGIVPGAIGAIPVNCPSRILVLCQLPHQLRGHRFIAYLRLFLD